MSAAEALLVVGLRSHGAGFKETSATANNVFPSSYAKKTVFWFKFGSRSYQA